MMQNMPFSMVTFIKIDTPQFSVVNRSQYSNGSDFKQKIIEYPGNNG